LRDSTDRRNVRGVRPSPRSLILDLLSTLPRGAMPVRALVEAAALFGISENGLRVALARLLAAGRVERDERGQYRLGSAARPLNELVVSWRRLDRRAVAWTGGWIGAHALGLARDERGAAARALRLLGFRALRRGLEIRPDNLAEGVGGVRERLRALGLPPSVPVFALTDLDPDSEARARSLWDARRLVAEYRATTARLEKSLAELAALGPETAMARSFVVGGRAIRQLALDPLLPDEIVPARERRALVEAMQRYDAAGRACWAPFLRRAGVVRTRAPAHQVTQTAAELEPAAGGVA
jgi:phenylacetic acid degradation operon negative regulatory protein